MITVNNRKMEYKNQITLSELLSELKYTFPKLYIRINGNYVVKADYGNVMIKDEDIISIIHPIAGG